jgi:neutral ceramidase
MAGDQFRQSAGRTAVLWTLSLIVLGVSLTGCRKANSPDIGSGIAGLPPEAACVLESPALAVGSSTDLVVNGVTYTKSHVPDAPGPLETSLKDVGPSPAGACQDSARFRFGSGLYDTTGPIGGTPTGHADLAGMILPPQPQIGIHTRLYARAFVVESPCNGKRVVYVSDDHTFSTALVRQEVLKRLAADPELDGLYTSDNVMLAATHTHAAGGGYGDPVVFPPLPAGVPQPLIDVYGYVQSLVISTSPFDADNFEAIVDGITRSIQRAHANLEAHPETASVKLSIGELLNANRSRDPPGYRQNPPSERARYVNGAGNEIEVDKRFLQLSFVRDDGSAAGVLNWFGVHPTVMGNHALMISADTKGEASLRFERLMRTQYIPDAGSSSTAPGADNFVAAFAQTDEGNSVPDLFIFDKDLDGNDGPGQGVPYLYRLGTDDPYDFDTQYYERGLPKASTIFSTKQLAQALKQFGAGTTLKGPVDYRFFYVDMSAIDVTDPEVLEDSTFSELSAELYPDERGTCTGAVGYGKFVGGANGPAFGAAGFTCVADAPVDVTDDLRNHYNNLFNGTGSIIVTVEGNRVTVPVDGVALYTATVPALCLAQALQPQYACQREKVVVTEFGGAPAPFQIFRIGNLAILGVPWEVTTMAGRRLRQTVLDALSPVGVDTVVISGLTNAYLDYMATREEYAAQLYEGASTDYGPWQLAAAQQEARRLALALATGESAPTGVAPEALALGPDSPITIDMDAEFGAIERDAEPIYKQGDTVDVSWVGGYPANDLKRMSSYLYVERENADGSWSVIATDKDPEVMFIWNGQTNVVSTLVHVATSSENEAVWTIPLDTPAGTYRIRHEGVSRASTDAEPEPYTGVTSTFKIEGVAAACPG